jgi:hypothetical protein
MRLAVTLAVDAGIRLCMPVHDGFLICSTTERLDADIAKMRAIMCWAGKLVTGGLAIRVDCKTVRYPDRYMDSVDSACGTSLSACWRSERWQRNGCDHRVRARGNLYLLIYRNDRDC